MKASSSLLSSPLLSSAAPFTVAGYGIFRELVESEGALPANTKALYVAVAAASKNWPEIAARELQRGAKLGLTRSAATAGVIVLSSLRGEGAAALFLEVLSSVFESSPGDAAAPVRVSVAEGEAEANFKQYFGTVPPALAKLLALSPRGADAYYLMRKGSIDSNPLSRKYAELMLLTVLAADYSPMAAVHIKGARAAGAADAEIAEAILCAIPVAGVAAWVSAAGHLDAA